MKNPKITVVIPTYHRPDLLARAIKSVQLQSFEDWECIVFSDHCPKAHLVYENYFSDDDRIRFIENPNEWVKNVGAVGVNYALRNSRSNIITYLCDDNIFLPNHFSSIHEAMNDETDLVQTYSYIIGINQGDGGIKAILQRGFFNDLKSTTHNKLPPNHPDMLQLAHKIDVIEKGVGFWKTVAEMEVLKEQGHNLPVVTSNEDGEFITRLFSYIKETKTTRVKHPTCIYYCRRACVTRDENYHNKVADLSDEETFVYPDILKEILN